AGVPGGAVRLCGERLGRPDEPVSPGDRRRGAPRAGGGPWPGQADGRVPRRVGRLRATEPSARRTTENSYRGSCVRCAGGGLGAAARAGWECIVYGDAGARSDLGLPGVRHRVLSGPPRPWWDQVALPRALAQDRVAVFLSPDYKGPLAAPCPVVITVHDLFF